jgi:hypothetical protein
MSNAETILEFLERFSEGVCDDCISHETGVEPRQQVYQICRRLEQRDTITRRKYCCALCGHTKTVNLLGRVASAPEVATPRRAAQLPREESRICEAEAVSIEALWKQLDRFCKALVERQKIPNGKNGLAALISLLADRGAVPLHLANMMHTIRGLRNAYVHDDTPMGKRETVIAQTAWDIIREWAESREGELWRRTRA